VREMLIHLGQAGIETPFYRFDTQKPYCGFGLSGTCCKNCCHMGPCRITQKSPKSICGADAHVIVAHNILRWVVVAVSVYGARGYEVMLALKGAAVGNLVRWPGFVRQSEG
jgi:carbon-monoxide dehydrogenase catalytic subunit